MGVELKERLSKFMDELYAPLMRPGEEREDQTLPEDALVIGRQPLTKQPTYFRHRELQHHLHVVGGPTSGKSNSLRCLADQLLRHKERTGEGFAIIDPHGPLARYVRNLMASKYPHLAKDLIHLDLEQTEKVLSYNPLALATEKNVEFVAGSLTEAIIKAAGERNSQDKPSIAQVLQFLHQALIYTVRYLPDMEFFFLRNEQNRAVFLHLLAGMPQSGPTRLTRTYWEDFDKKTRQTIDGLTVGPFNRLLRLTQPVQFRRILAAPHASLDVRQAMDDGAICLFDLSAPPDSNVSPDGQNLMAALLVQEFNQAWRRRVADKSRPFVLVMDEFGDYVSGDMARTLTGSRKFGLWCVFAHQNLSQLIDRDDDRELLYTVLAIPNRLVFGAGSLYLDEAETLARQMYLAFLDPDRIKHVVRTISFEPVTIEYTKTVNTRSGGASESAGEDTGESGGTRKSTGVSTDPETGRQVESTQTGEDSSWARRSSYNFTTQEGWSESQEQAWRTEYRRLVQEGAVTFDNIERADEAPQAPEEARMTRSLCGNRTREFLDRRRRLRQPTEVVNPPTSVPDGEEEEL